MRQFQARPCRGCSAAPLCRNLEMVLQTAPAAPKAADRQNISRFPPGSSAEQRRQGHTPRPGNGSRGSSGSCSFAESSETGRKRCANHRFPATGLRREYFGNLRNWESDLGRKRRRGKGRRRSSTMLKGTNGNRRTADWVPAPPGIFDFISCRCSRDRAGSDRVPSG